VESKVTPFEILLYLVSIPLLLFGLYKARISGFYDDESTTVFGSLLFGAALLFLAGRIGKNRKRAALQERDRAKGIG
jgi:hypothetical protein